MNTPADIDARIKTLETLIRETRDRLPAHSVKPRIMAELLAYEDEYDNLMARKKSLAKGNPPQET